jgi:hypothetical protein
MEVLFSPGATGRERANVHGDMLELVYETLHADIGLRREYVPTYGQIEGWRRPIWSSIAVRVCPRSPPRSQTRRARQSVSEQHEHMGPLEHVLQR